MTRRTVEPEGIFDLIQCEISKIGIKPYEIQHNFKQSRIYAEKLARKQVESEEIKLSQIYDVFAQRFSLSKDTIAILQNLEQKLELENCFGIPYILNIINNIRDQDKRIVFASDTYLPKDLIHKMLERVGAFHTGDGLYISSEYLMTKTSGKLFYQIIHEEGCSPSNIIHIGDNPLSDVSGARRAGLKAFYFPNTRLNRYEEILLRKGNQKSERIKWQLLAGASRLARLSLIDVDESHQTLSALGANFAGPTLLGYIIWVLRQAQISGLQRLYFVARDGQVLLDLSKRTCERLGLKFDLRYLYGSRQAWHLPSTTQIGNRELTWMLVADPILSIRILSNRIGLDPEATLREITSFTGKNWNLDYELSNIEIDELKSTILCSKLHDFILKKAQEERASVLAYLTQEGLDDNVKWGIVDLGWFGNMQESLSRILESSGKRRSIHGFYFGLVRSCTDEADGNSMHAFFFHHDAPKRYKVMAGKSGGIMEVLTSADHGTTLSYKKSGNIWLPVLKEQIDNSALDWGLIYLRKGIFKFLELLPVELLEALLVEENIDDYRERLLHCMRSLYFKPSYKEAQVIGSYCFSSDQSETQLKQFAPPFSIIDTACKLVNLSKPYKQSFITNWMEGSLARSSIWSRQALLVILALKRLCRHI